MVSQNDLQSSSNPLISTQNIPQEATKLKKTTKSKSRIYGNR